MNYYNPGEGGGGGRRGVHNERFHCISTKPESCVI